MRFGRHITTRGAPAIALSLLCVWCAACATTDLAPIRSSEFAPEEDEQKLWKDSAAVEKALRDSELVYDDAAATDYVNRVSTQLLPHLDGPTTSVRVTIVRDPFLNAFALPNGAIYVHTGLLAAVENEAQLATVLGHEVVHYLHRHALRERRTTENRQAVAQGVLSVLAVAAAGFTGDVNAARTLMRLGTPVADSVISAQVNGFSRDLEREADQRGFHAMAAAGYDPGEAPKVFETLREQEEEAGVNEPFFFGDHPALDERIATFRTLLAEHGTARGESGERTFLDGIGKLLLVNAALDVRIRRLARARHSIERYSGAFPQDPQGPFDLGELERRFGKDPNAAIEAYRRAVALDGGFAAAQRELGLLLQIRGDGGGACVALKRYLELAKDAADRPIITGYLEEIDECSAP